MRQDKKSLAIIILNWNGAAMLKQFLPSVIDNLDEDSYLVVADNASTDDSLSVMREHFPSVPLLCFAENYGFAEGYNRAIAEIDAPLIILLNSDVEVSPQWLAPLRDYMEGHPNCAACQPKLRSWARRTHFEYAGAAGGYIDAYGYPYCRGRLMDTIEEDKGQYDTPTPVHWATGAALLVRRADYLAVGGLDARFFAHMEEIDFCWRLHNHGKEIACVPQSTVYHVGGATLQQGNPRKTFLNFRNNLLMLYKNLPEERLAKVLRMRYWLDRLAWLKCCLTLDWANARAIMAARRAYKEMLPSYAEIRTKGLLHRAHGDNRAYSQFSLLYHYYLRGHKTFVELPAPK